MPTAKQSTTHWPNSLQQPLLRAAFLSGDAGLSAWETWKSQVNMDDYPDPGSFRLLPQLYRNLQNQGLDDPLMLKLKGIARQSWFRNQRDFSTLAPHLQTLKEAGVDILMPGGAALALRYPDYILNIEPVLSLLVQPDQAVTTMKQLGALGWKPATRSPEVLLRAYVAHRDMQSFHGPNNQRLRLFWHWLPGYPDDSIWAKAETLELHNITVFVLSPTDQILYICAQGQALATRPLFWRAIDVMLILQAAQGSIDWDRLISQTQQHQLQPCVTETLSYIQDKLDAPLPGDVLARLNSLPASSSVQTQISVEFGKLMIWPRLTRLWSNYLDYTGPLNLGQRIYYFPQYLQYFWRLEHLWHVPMRVISAALHHLR